MKHAIMIAVNKNCEKIKSVVKLCQYGFYFISIWVLGIFHPRKFHPGKFHYSKFHPGHVHPKVQLETVEFFIDEEHDSNPNPNPFTWWNLPGLLVTHNFFKIDHPGNHI